MAKRSDLERRDAAPSAPSRAGSGKDAIAAFLQAARDGDPRPASRRGGRLIFALDATMSRQPTWDTACSLQDEMFRAAGSVGELAVQLVYFRGLDEARASKWVRDAAALGRVMRGVACHGGLTQIGRVLDHAEREAAKAPLAALVYVGDAMEEDIDALCARAGALAIRGVRAFMFLEGSNPAARRAFAEIARLTRGVLIPFDRASADELRSLLGAVAAFAAGGRPALEASGAAAARRLLADLGP
jgi:hypothetical protein